MKDLFRACEFHQYGEKFTMAILHKELALRFIIIMVFIGMSVPDVRTSSCNVFLLDKLLKADCSNRGFK